MDTPPITAGDLDSVDPSSQPHAEAMAREVTVIRPGSAGDATTSSPPDPVVSTDLKALAEEKAQPDDPTAIRSADELDVQLNAVGSSIRADGVTEPEDAALVSPPRDLTPAAVAGVLRGKRLNHFLLAELIGGGGMGAVFRARDERLGRTVAVKVIPFAGKDRELQRRFRNEAQSAARLDHPLIARVFEVGNDGPWHYIVFEYIAGTNVRDLVAQNGPLPIDDAVFFTCQVAEALDHASRRGIVHRDIKPSNIVVTPGGNVKLVDMGLARSDSLDSSEDLTASGVTLGTFDYISPEQARDPRLADIRSDLYSLGCTLYFMLTQEPPFPGGTMLQKLLSHGNASIPDVRELCPDATPDLAAVINKLLAKSPDKRYQRAKWLIADLHELAQRENLVRSLGVAPSSVPVNPSPWMDRLRRHLPWMVAASLLLISAGWLELFSWQERRDFSIRVPESAQVLAPVSQRTLATEVPTPTSFDNQPLRGTPSTQANDVNTLSNSGLTPSVPRPRPADDRTDDEIRSTLPSELPDRPNDDSRIPVSPPSRLDAVPLAGNATTSDPESSTTAGSESSLEALRELRPPFGPANTSSMPPSLSNLQDDLRNPLVATASENGLLNEPVLAPPLNATLPFEPIQVRVVSQPDLLDRRTRLQAEQDQSLLTDSLGDAMRLASERGLTRVEIALPVLVTDPVVVPCDDLVIRSSSPGGTAIVFRSTDEIDMQRSTMFAVGSHTIEITDLHFFWTVPSSEADGGSVFLLNENKSFRLTDCSITVDNPSRRDEVYAFDVITDPAMVGSASDTSLTGQLPLVSMELYNTIIRGQMSMLHMDVAAELQMRWENGLLAVTGHMLQSGGALTESGPTRRGVELFLNELTCWTPPGLIQMRCGVSSRYPVRIERGAEDCVFIVDRQAAYIELDGIPTPDLEEDWVQIRGSGNAYEVDTTLKNPLLIIRDSRRLTQMTIIFEKLAIPDEIPTWSEERTPIWSVRWTNPLPREIAPSKLLPRDFRQDGTLSFGLQEFYLPEVPTL